jgi:MATE family multidrug resistance protein
MERTRIIMIVSGLACMINFGLNWTLIFGHLGFPALGLIGSGYATAIVWWGMGIALALYAWRQRLLPEDLFRLSGREVARGAGAVWQLGWPISAAWAVEVGLFSGASLLMGHFGEVALAAHQICLNLCSFTYMVPFSIGNAAAVRVGFHVGGGALRRARIAGFTAITLGISFMVLAALALLLASRQIFSLYLDASDPNLPAVVALGTKLLMVAALFQVFDGGQAVASGCLRGLKDTRAALVAETLGYWGVGMPTGIAFAFWAGWGPIGLWAGWVPALAAVALLLCLRFRHRTGRLIEDTRIGGALAEPA